jgi:hypothetical protein
MTQSYHITTHTFSFRISEILSCKPEVTLLEVLAAKPLSALRSFDHYPVKSFIKWCQKLKLHSIKWLDEWKMNWRGCGTKQPWPKLRYYPSICIEGPRKTTNNSGQECQLIFDMAIPWIWVNLPTCSVHHTPQRSSDKTESVWLCYIHTAVSRI